MASDAGGCVQHSITTINTTEGPAMGAALLAGVGAGYTAALQKRAKLL